VTGAVQREKHGPGHGIIAKPDQKSVKEECFNPANFPDGSESNAYTYEEGFGFMVKFQVPETFAEQHHDNNENSSGK
jgi:hypothetical protein